MAVSSARMEYQDPDIRDRREYIAARRAMSQEAADVWAPGSSANLADNSASASSASGLLPALEIDSGAQASGQAETSAGDRSRHYGTAGRGEISETVTVSGDNRSQRLETRPVENVSVGSQSVRDALGSVNQQQVQDGLNLGVMRGFQPTASTPYGQGVANLYNWLDRQIPRDGTTVTEDRRTALLVNLAYADAQARHPGEPGRWEQDAYDSLLYLRTSMAESGRAQLPPELRGRENDPDVSAAEHFFETSLLVDRGRDLGLPTAVAGAAAAVTHHSYAIYQTLRRAFDSGYESSEPGLFRMRWENAGVLRGMDRGNGTGQVPGETGRAGETGGDDVERIVIIGERLSNENRGTESSVSNVDSGTSPYVGGSSDQSGNGSSFDTNGSSDSGMLADGRAGSSSSSFDSSSGFDSGSGSYGGSSSSSFDSSGGFDSGFGSYGGWSGGGGSLFHFYQE